MEEVVRKGEKKVLQQKHQKMSHKSRGKMMSRVRLICEWKLKEQKKKIKADNSRKIYEKALKVQQKFSLLDHTLINFYICHRARVLCEKEKKSSFVHESTTSITIITVIVSNIVVKHTN